MATPRAPLVLVLCGEPDKLVSKPDTYVELLQLARKPKIFGHKLKNFNDEEISFRFKWDDTEVDLDESAFEFVNARARLRIITPGQAAPIKSEQRSTSAISEPPLKRVKVEDCLTGQARVVIDLTDDGLDVDLPDRALKEEHQPIFANTKGTQKKDDQPDAEGQNIARDEAGKRNVMPCVFTSDKVHFGRLERHIQEQGYPTERPMFLLQSNRRFFSSAGIKSGDTVHVYKSDKPGISLLPPCTDSSAVKFGKLWKFNTIYPWTKIKAVDGIEKAEWEASVDKWGNTVSKSGPDEYFGHLSWETTLNTAVKPRADKTLPFDPAFPNLNPQNSVVVHRRHVLSKCSGHAQRTYFEEVLTIQLGLPKDIVRDLQNYFDAQFDVQILKLGSQFSIAISFVSQRHIEKAARISISPKPDATARILMLFGAVDTTQTHGIWSAWAKVALEEKNWAKVTGIQPKVLRTMERSGRSSGV
ncbi:hypothetical protein VP1G_10673 [Cytospora mali]|uniref:Uncharacterized protein n=1 Tax=Cytospora mali TaxID=578113 RepID=A0A194USJ8_CYTMA|nr:hypothetical protein VP1G_10673 [Valsa mali var. pyri (nom. inval.)]